MELKNQSLLNLILKQFQFFYLTQNFSCTNSSTSHLHFGLKASTFSQFLRQTGHQIENYQEIFYDTKDRKLISGGQFWLKKKIMRDTNEIWSFKRVEEKIPDHELNVISYHKSEGSKESILKQVKDTVGVEESELVELGKFKITRHIFQEGIKVDICEMRPSFFYSSCQIEYSPGKEDKLKELFGDALFLPVQSKILTYLYLLKEEDYNKIPSKEYHLNAINNLEGLLSFICPEYILFNDFNPEELKTWFNKTYDGEFKDIGYLADQYSTLELFNCSYTKLVLKGKIEHQDLLNCLYYVLRSFDGKDSKK